MKEISDIDKQTKNMEKLDAKQGEFFIKTAATSILKFILMVP